VQIPLVVKWIGVFVFSGLLGGSMMMLFKGTLPPPLTKVRVNPIVSTSLFVLGMTGVLLFGEPELLQNTINLALGK